jgi:hypothetical protein
MSPANGVVAAESNGTPGSLTITVTPKAIPQTSPVLPNLYGDVLTVTTTVAGDTPHVIALSQTAQGAIFSIAVQTIDFGNVQQNGQATFQLYVSNAGNLGGRLDFAATSPFTLPNELLDPNPNAVPLNLQFSPLDTGVFPMMVPITVDPSTVLCAPLPFQTLSLTGTGTAPGQKLPSLGATWIDFQPLACGAATGNKSGFPFVNQTASPITAISATVTQLNNVATAFTVAVEAQDVPAGQPTNITVTPNAMPATSSTQADLFVAGLVITTTPPFPIPTVWLHETASGAVLRFYPSSIDFAATPVGQSTGIGGNFYLVNTGNQPVTPTLSPISVSAFSLTQQQTVTGPGQPILGNVVFSPMSTGMFVTNVSVMSVAAGGVLCALPTGLAVAGTGN